MYLSIFPFARAIFFLHVNYTINMAERLPAREKKFSGSEIEKKYYGCTHECITVVIA